MIPTLNQGGFLADALQSVLGQEYPDLEVLVVDGGSTDDTSAVLERYSDRIAYKRSRRDSGQADAINEGMDKATGQVLCWLNSDDMYLPGTLLDVGRRLAALPEAPALLYGGAVTIDEDTHRVGAQPPRSFDKGLLRYSNYLPQPSTFWTRALWERVGGLDVTKHYTLDWEWFIRATKVVAFQPVARYYSLYRFHRGHKSSRGGEVRRQEILEVVRTYAPPRWHGLYQTAHSRYDAIARWDARLRSWRVPRPDLLLPLLFPALWRYMHHRHDLNVVRAVLG